MPKKQKTWFTDPKATIPRNREKGGSKSAESHKQIEARKERVRERITDSRALETPVVAGSPLHPRSGDSTDIFTVLTTSQHV